MRILVKTISKNMVALIAMPDPSKYLTHKHQIWSRKLRILTNRILKMNNDRGASILRIKTFQLQILSENRMGNEGAKAVCDLLTENKTITYLDLKGM